MPGPSRPTTLLAMGLLSHETDSHGGAAYAEGLEFEETFPEASVATEAPRLTLVANEHASVANDRGSAANAARPDGIADQIDRRLREAEDLVKDTVERLRLEEERRLMARIEEMFTEWQARFEHRLDQRRAEEERSAEKRRLSDEERLRTWRRELEQSLIARFRESDTQRAPLADRTGETRVSLREAIASARTARDV